MNWKNPKLKVLGLDEKEKEILSLLKDPINIQDLSRKSPIPRTTLAYIIKKLAERGFIEKVRIGNRFKYYSISLERLRSDLEDAHMHEGREEHVKSLVSPVSNKKILCYQGLKNIIRVQAHFLSTAKDERVFAIQPNKSWLGLHSKVDPDRVIHLNDVIRNNNLIIEGIIEHDAYEQFRKANRSKRKFMRLANSFGNRMADYVAAPQGYLTDQIEMWIIKNTVLFIDWREEVAIKISDIHMAHFLKDMFTLVKESGTKIDHNQSIRRVSN